MQQGETKSMKGTMIILRANGEREERSVDYVVGLTPLQKAVGGYIEAVPYFAAFEGKRCVAYCNEEGKLKDLAVNAKATEAWWEQAPVNDILVGDVVVLVGDSEFLAAI